MPADLRSALEPFADGMPPGQEARARVAFDALKAALNAGTVRAAERGATAVWTRQRLGQGRASCSASGSGKLAPAATGGPFPFFDKDTYPLRTRRPRGRHPAGPGRLRHPGRLLSGPGRGLHAAHVHQRRARTSTRAPWWTPTPWSAPARRSGKRVHLSAAAQIGGVLEPAGALPVIIEDEVLVGGNCGVYEGTIVRERAVLAPGMILTGGTAVFDLVHDRVYRREGDRPLEIPAGAVVVPGTRPVTSGPGPGGRRSRSTRR